MNKQTFYIKQPTSYKQKVSRDQTNPNKNRVHNSVNNQGNIKKTGLKSESSLLYSTFYKEPHSPYP
jgi:hypothetical protein